MQKDKGKEILNYIDMKILAQVNCIRNPSESKIREAKNEDPDNDFVYYKLDKAAADFYYVSDAVVYNDYHDLRNNYP